MNGFKIITDSASDLDDGFLSENDIGVVPFYITADGNAYCKDKVEITSQEFYKVQRESKKFYKTSLPSVQDYLDEFNKYASDVDIICFCLSSKLSGSYQSAVNAANIIKDEHPERVIVVIDSQTASLGIGMKIKQAVLCRGRGMTAVQAEGYLLQNVAYIALTVDTLEYLQRGGRIGKVQALAGELLNIRPIIQMVGGELVPHSKMRGRGKAVARLLEILDEAVGADLPGYVVAVAHSDCEEEARALRDQIEQKYGIFGKVDIVEIGVVIGAHTGPSVLAISYLRNLSEG